jgi:DNA polymerase-1
MEKSYSEILRGLEKKPDRKLNDHVLIVDSMNTFIRSFAVLQNINPQGHHTGGLIGFLRSLGYLVRTFEPTRVICVFDGQGSSVNRKNMNSDYKSQRNIKRITNWELFDDKEDEYSSMTMQMHRLIEYLQCLPLTLISIDKVEADDIISYTAQQYSTAGKQITIVSSDKDFLQIVNNNIQVYSPIEKKIYGVKEVEEKIGTIPKNYLMVKALTGDDSDNLSGIKGLGIKTILSQFPEVKSNPEYTLENIYKICEEKLKTRKIFANIIYDWDRVKLNYELMNIQQPRVSEQEIETVREKVAKPIPPLQTGPFLRMLEWDQIEGLNKNPEGWLELFRPLTTYRK